MEEVPSRPRREGEEDRGEEGADCLHSNMGSSNFEDGCMDVTQFEESPYLAELRMHDSRIEWLIPEGIEDSNDCRSPRQNCSCQN